MEQTKKEYPKKEAIFENLIFEGTMTVKQGQKNDKKWKKTTLTFLTLEGYKRNMSFFNLTKKSITPYKLEIGTKYNIGYNLDDPYIGEDGNEHQSKTLFFIGMERVDMKQFQTHNQKVEGKVSSKSPTLNPQSIIIKEDNIAFEEKVYDEEIEQGDIIPSQLEKDLWSKDYSSNEEWVEECVRNNISEARALSLMNFWSKE